MKTGIIISGIGHVALLILVTINLPWGEVKRDDDMEIAVVTTISSSQLDAMASVTPDAPAMDVNSMSMPSPEANDTTAPTADVAPQETEIDITEDPSERDTDADLSALLEGPPNPEVAVVSDQLETPVPASDDSPNVMVPARPDNFAASETPSGLVSLSTPPVPRSNTPTISTQPDTPAQEDNLPTSEPDTPPVEDTPEPDISEAAPQTAALPIQRPSSISAAAQQLQREAEEAEQQLQREAEEAAAREALEQAAAEAAAQADDQANDITDLVNQIAADVANSDTPSPNNNSDLGGVLTGAEMGNIAGAIAANWNTATIAGKEGYENLVVKVFIEILPDGTIVRESVRPEEPANPTGDFAVAYETARRAVLQAGRLPLPERYSEGANMIIQFDPVAGIGVN